jgi:hypothetical protein
MKFLLLSNSGESATQVWCLPSNLSKEIAEGDKVAAFSDIVVLNCRPVSWHAPVRVVHGCNVASLTSGQKTERNGLHDPLTMGAVSNMATTQTLTLA